MKYITVSPAKKFEPDAIRQEKSSKEDCDSIIDKLNDDCLIYIFRLLSVADRILVERVCKKWQEVALESWSKFNELEMHSKYLGLKPFGFSHKCSEITPHVVEEILKRCGRYLEKINFPFSRLDYTGFVAQYCKNIQSITCYNISVEGLNELSNNCRNIHEFRIRGFRNGTLPQRELALTKLFLSNRKLRALKIDDFKGSGECLLKLPFSEMEEILISENTFMESMKTTVLMSNNLKSFKCFSIKASIITALTFSCRNLTVLKLYCVRDNIINHEINKVDELLSHVFHNNKQLKTLGLGYFESLTGKCFLHLNKNTVEKIILTQDHGLQREYLTISLPSFAKLHTLEFRSFYGYTDNDAIAECISLCGKLKKLTLFDMIFYSEENLMKSVSNLKNVEILRVRAMMENVATKSFIDYISHNLQELKHLHLGDCADLSDNDLQ